MPPNAAFKLLEIKELNILESLQKCYTDENY